MKTAEHSSIDISHNSEVLFLRNLVGDLQKQNEGLLNELKEIKNQIKESANRKYRKDPITLPEMIPIFLKEKEAETVTEDRIRAYNYIFRVLDEFMKERGVEYINDIDRAFTTAFFVELTNLPKKRGSGKLARTTAVTYYTILRSMLAVAADNELITEKKWLKKSMPKPRKKVRWTEEYVKKLIAAIRKRAWKNSHVLETVIRLDYTTGLRIIKILGIKKKDVRIEGDRVFVTTMTKARGEKKNTPHEVELLDDEAKKMFLEEYNKPERNTYALMEDDKTPRNRYKSFQITLGGFKKKGKDERGGICLNEGFEWLGFHSGKKMFITERVNENISYEKIGKLTGNKNIQVLKESYDCSIAEDFSEEIKENLRSKTIVI